MDVDGQIDSVHLFLSPRQVHLLLDMVAAIAGPGKYYKEQKKILQDKNVSSVEKKLLVQYYEFLSDISKVLCSCCELGL